MDLEEEGQRTQTSGVALGFLARGGGGWDGDSLRGRQSGGCQEPGSRLAPLRADTAMSPLKGTARCVFGLVTPHLRGGLGWKSSFETR